MQTIEEIKNHKNKATQRFSCELLLREAGHVVLQYRAEEAGRVGDIAIAPGSTTIAHYWHDRHYVLWRMFDNRGCLIGTLFHICTDVVITDTSVSYLDLLLDIWITPQGQIRIFDEDELQECVRAGLIDKNEQRIIETQKQTITSGFDHIINKILEDTLQIDIPSAVPPGGGLSHP